jgi:hypothetical protein
MEQKQNAPMAKKRQKRRGWQMPLNPRSSAPLGASSSLESALQKALKTTLDYLSMLFLIGKI